MDAEEPLQEQQGMLLGHWPQLWGMHASRPGVLQRRAQWMQQAARVALT